MDGGGGHCRDLSRLISELTQGKELTRQLENHMERSSPTEQCKHLVQSLLSTWDKAISMARSSNEWAGTESPGSPSGSPRSEGSDRAPRDHQPESREMIKKRKALPKMTRQVKVGSGTMGLEGPLDDGFSWRKYGQKDILGAKYPRGYYRCTHRHSHGCPALKLVQRSDDDPSVFDVTYRGRHTCCVQGDCNPPGETSSASATAAAEHHHQQQQQQQVGADQPHTGQGSNAAGNALLPGFGPRLTLKTEGLDDGGCRFPFPPSPFSFPPTPVGWASQPSPAAAALPDSTFAGGFSPPFLSPRAASEPTSLPAPPAQVGAFGGEQSSPAPESGVAELFYGDASGSTDLGFILDPMESDPNFPFDYRFFPSEFH